MIRWILVIVAVIFIILLTRFIRLMRQFSSGSHSTIDNQKKHRDDIDKHFRDVEEAHFREIPPDEEIDSSQKKDG
jgi:hypothetical protein